MTRPLRGPLATAAMIIPLPGLAATGATADKPNSLVIMADDIGSMNLSSYGGDIMGVQTPNIDSIGAEGLRLTSFAAQPNRTTGSATFISDQLPVRTGLTPLSTHSAVLATLAVLFVGIALIPLDASAARGGGGHARTSVHRGGSAHINRNAHVNRNANINRNANVNRHANVNVNRNANVNVNRHVDVDVHRGWNHPVGTAVAIGATAAVVGSILYSLPPSCTMVQSGGVTYQRCGSTWYQPRYAGSSVQYVVVDSPY